MEDKTKIVVSDLNGIHDLILSVDWEEREFDKNVEASVGDMKMKLNKLNLWQAVFSIIGKEKQAEMIPVAQRNVRDFSKHVTIKATKDIKAGETIVAPVTFTISEEIIDELIRIKQATPKT
jgi:hypothetical protein